MYEYLRRKNNKQKRGSESQWAMIISVLPAYLGVAINTDMTLQMENIIRQEHQDHSTGGGKRMRFLHSINQKELSKPDEPASGDHKKVNRELLVEKKWKQKIIKPSVGTRLLEPDSSSSLNFTWVASSLLLEVCPALWSLECSGHGTASVCLLLVCAWTAGSPYESGLASKLSHLPQPLVHACATTPSYNLKSFMQSQSFVVGQPWRTI